MEVMYVPETGMNTCTLNVLPNFPATLISVKY